MVTAVVFDFDGTLVDSLDVKYQARFKLFASEAPQIQAIAAETIPKIRGKLRAEIIRAILTQTHPDLPPEAFEEKVMDYVKRYDELVEDLIVAQGLFPGTREALERLGERHPLYIFSGTPDYALQRLLKRLEIEHLFRAAHGIDPSRQERAGILKLENLNKIITTVGGASADILVVGDGAEDLESAQACHCQFIGIRSERKDWSQQSIVQTINSVAELPALPLLDLV